MKTDTSKQILNFIEQNGQARVKDLIDFLGFSQVAVQKQLKKLVQTNQLEKLGKPPKVFYVLKTETKSNFTLDIPPDLKKLIEENFLQIIPDGQILSGQTGFDYFCQKTNLDPNKTALEYQQILSKYNPFKKNDLIDASFKIKQTFSNQIWLDKMYYLDFYSVERFGKTKLAQLTFQAKQSQDQNLLKQIASAVKDKIWKLLILEKIEAVGFVPPTVKRQIQFQTEMTKLLSLPVPHIKLVKIIKDTPLQQKSLKKQTERVFNAIQTMFVDDSRKFGKILLLDDFVGSGATLNILAKKLKQNQNAKEVIGLALTGSLKGFEVINQI